MSAASIRLQAVGPEDAELIFNSWGRDQENFAWLTARVFSTTEDARHYLASLFPTPESRAFHIVHDDAIVGLVKANIAGHRAQIGYVVHRPFWGRGFATAAVLQLTSIVERFPQISRMWATCAIANRASARVLEKSGFELEGVLKNWVTYPAQGANAFDNYSYVKIPVRSPEVQA